MYSELDYMYDIRYILDRVNEPVQRSCINQIPLPRIRFAVML
jgi:hypothetical protein